VQGFWRAATGVCEVETMSSPLKKKKKPKTVRALKRSKKHFPFLARDTELVEEHNEAGDCFATVLGETELAGEWC
jgi:hypothetical protein